jgi:hypothetical protein
VIPARRNPYLIIGVDFATGKSEARREFARKAKARRREPSSAYSVEDLTWALSEIEDVINRPEESVDIFRVPADPTVFRPDAPGLLNPPPAVLERSTQRQDPAARAVAARRAADDLLTASLAALAASVQVAPAISIVLPPPTLDRPGMEHA